MGWYKSHFDIIILFGSLIIASVTRIVLPFRMVFQNGQVIFNTVDAYYQLRFADLISAHFPQTHFFDPYLGYLSSIYIGDTSFFNLLLVFFGKLFNNLDVVAAYLPAILGILTIVSVFVIAKYVFKNKWVSGFAVLVVAVLPGEFLSRTQLGAADYHCLELFLTTMMMMWVILAITVKRYWLKVLFALLALGFLWLYFISWNGGLVFISIFGVSLYLWGSFLWLKKHPTIKANVILHSCVFGSLGVIIFLSYFVVRYGYPTPIATLPFPIPDNISIMFSKVRFVCNLFTWRVISNTMEELPLLSSYSSSSESFVDLNVSWSYFGFAFFLTLIGMGMLIYRVFKYRENAEILLLSWSLIMLFLTLAMRRWSYYLAINIGILTAYSGVIIGSEFVKRGKSLAMSAVICILLAMMVIVPLIKTDVELVRNPVNYMSKGWRETTQWLRSQLSPVQDAEYYISYTKDGKPNDVPVVLLWWDYGYWVVRQSHMVAIANPGCGVPGRELAAQMFMSEDYDSAVKQLRECRIKYIVIDNLTAIEKFYAIASHAKLPIGRYYEYYEEELFRTPAYFKTLLCELYFFGGENIGGIHLVFESSNKVLVDNQEIPEVKVFKVTKEY